VLHFHAVTFREDRPYQIPSRFSVSLLLSFSALLLRTAAVKLYANWDCKNWLAG
jgi:hypothetical protein